MTGDKIRMEGGTTPSPGRKPAAKVELLQLAKRGNAVRVKIRHLDEPFEGLEEWVPASRLVARWSEWSRIKRAEEREIALREECVSKGLPDPVVVEAAEAVL